MTIHSMSNITKPVINHVYLWGDGLVAVFDQFGDQMQEYQGKYADVRDNILADAPDIAVFYSYKWTVSGNRDIVNRSEW